VERDGKSVKSALYAEDPGKSGKKNLLQLIYQQVLTTVPS
jgi:hypothetical protein